MFALTVKGGTANSLAPDVCKVPAPPAGPIPTPLVNMFQLNMANPGTISTKVMMDGAFALNAQTKVPISSGDEAGVAGGVVSNVFIQTGTFSPSSASMKVMIEGKPAVAMTAQTFHNGDASFNTTGICPMGQNAKVMIS
ncbi:MAG: DUF4150 domain-containing protein [Deltaproteobacteria bacterium]|jgi:hypothetical protein|nr:DUF4150 domain-containing protein [Deltaproteobacteria bacterium]